MAGVRIMFFTVLFILGFASYSFATIIQSNNQPIVGCVDTFQTNITGNNYQWIFGPNTYPDSLSGTGAQSASTVFLTPGMHTVIVFITTNGGLAEDSININVRPNTANISLAAGQANCPFQYGTYTATPASYPEYAFFVNNVLEQLSASNTFGASLNGGDSVRVFGLNGTCFTNSSTPIYIHATPPPTLISSIPSDTICAGQLVTFTALPDTYDTYNFYIGGSCLQRSASNTWSFTQLYNDNIIHVDAVKNGCTSVYWSNQDTMIVKPVPEATLASNALPSCPGDTIIFSAQVFQALADSFYFFINSQLVQSGPTGTFYLHSNNPNDTISVIASYNGCTSRMSNPVLPFYDTIPSISISGPIDLCQGQSAYYTATATLGGKQPVYQWKVNELYTGTDSSDFTYSHTKNNDTISCILISSATCAKPDTVISQPIVVSVSEMPSTPTISQSGDTLIASSLAGYYEWYLNSVLISVNYSQQYIPTESGYYNVQCCNHGCCSGLSFPFEITILNGLTQIANDPVLDVFPNPSGNKIELKATGTIPDWIILYNINGQKISEQKFIQILDISSLSAGIYFIEVRNKEVTIRKKFVKL